MMDDMNCEPMIAELLNTKFGKYLSDHPFFALVLLVFGVIASVPIGLFLVFAVVTFVAVTVFFVFVESDMSQNQQCSAFGLLPWRYRPMSTLHESER
ncbi:hypothetical protein P4O66_000681 [Electrophorus voltai]|uniref:Uncharacterized protein n=1 Tax=Electrophorus voltai TaxID=2609070 RepID=A0AAD8ZFN2_9TELE|nr:hypothetical protein P4O66_000681 [Electrophorus voltai]